MFGVQSTSRTLGTASSTAPLPLPAAVAVSFAALCPLMLRGPQLLADLQVHQRLREDTYSFPQKVGIPLHLGLRCEAHSRKDGAKTPNAQQPSSPILNPSAIACVSYPAILSSLIRNHTVAVFNSSLFHHPRGSTVC